MFSQVKIFFFSKTDGELVIYLLEKDELNTIEVVVDPFKCILIRMNFKNVESMYKWAVAVTYVRANKSQGFNYLIRNRRRPKQILFSSSVTHCRQQKYYKNKERIEDIQKEGLRASGH